MHAYNMQAIAITDSYASMQHMHIALHAYVAS